MTIFKVKAKYTTYLVAEIEAKDEDEAYEIAHNMDGGSFDEIDVQDWDVYDVEPTHP